MNYWKLPLSDLSLVKVIVKVYKQDSWYTLQSWRRSFLSTGSGFSTCTCSFCKTFPQPAFEWSQKLYPLAQYAVEVPVKLRYNIGSCCETSQWRFSSRQPSYSENKPQRLNIWSSCLRPPWKIQLQMESTEDIKRHCLLQVHSIYFKKSFLTGPFHFIGYIQRLTKNSLLHLSSCFWL